MLKSRERRCAPAGHCRCNGVLKGKNCAELRSELRSAADRQHCYRNAECGGALRTSFKCTAVKKETLHPGHYRLQQGIIDILHHRNSILFRGYVMS